MKGMIRRMQVFAVLVGIAAFAVITIGTPAAFAQQASITLLNCNNTLCNANNTDWTLDKTPASQSVTGDGTITWTVAATKGATTANFITVNGLITVKNTGTADATIGNIVVNLQKPRLPGPTPPGHPCRNVPWVSAAADVATASSGDAATSANIVAAASTEVVACNVAQGGPVAGPPASNYAVSGTRGTFSETAASGSLEFTDANSNTTFSLTPEVSLAPNASITLLYTAQFNNTTLGLPVGSQVRAEVVVTFGNSGPRGGSGSSAQDIDIDGDGTVNNPGDEHLVRSVPCRVTSTIPALLNGNSTVTLSDTSSDVVVTVDNVTLGTFSTTIGGGTGSEDISSTTSRTVSVDETCTPPGSAIITNTARLDGQSSSVVVDGPIDPITGLPIKFTFTCVTGVDLETPADADVTCDLPPLPKINACTYTQGGYHGTGVPGDLFDANYITVFGSGLTIGIEDNAGPKHDASWTGDTTGRTALKTYLTGGGLSGQLTADTSNATSVSGGALAKQTATLTLNVGFAIGSDNTVGTGNLGSLELCNLVENSVIGSFTLTAAQAVALNGQSVSNVLAAANNALGGNGLPSYVGSFGNLNELVTALNGSFDNCVASAFATANLCAAP